MRYRDFLQQVIYRIINPLIVGMIRIGITPNIVTFLGFVGNCVAAALFIFAATHPDSSQASLMGYGGCIILVAGLFDMMDGRLARLGNMSSTFGALWDSTLDRYSELVTLFGVVLYFTEGNDRFFVFSIITFMAMVGSIMVSYVRARAEGIGISCKVGLMQRPERVVVTALGAIITGLTNSPWPLAVAMAIIALLANITAFWRVWHCYRTLTTPDHRPSSEVHTPQA